MLDRNPIPIAMVFFLSLGSHLLSAGDVRFSAKVAEIRITRSFETGTIVTSADPRHVLRVTLEQDVEGIGKRGESVSFAIHSPARDLGIPDQRTAVGSRLHLQLGIPKEGGIHHLRRITTDNAGNAPPAGDGKPAD